MDDTVVDLSGGGTMRCDSHVHIVGSPERYPQLSTRTYLAGMAPLSELQRRAVTRDVSRFVLVQPSFYGTDNTLLLEGLDALGDWGRGVAVIDPEATTPGMLADYANRGVRGLRLNFYSTHAGREVSKLDDSLSQVAKLAQMVDWHVEVIAAIDVLAANADLLNRTQVPIVIDHYGLYGNFLPQTAEARRVLKLLRNPQVWIKLSAPYRVSENPLNTRPDKAWLAAILACAADRCVWGSDWPHTPPHGLQDDGAVPLPYRALSYEKLVDDFLAAVGSNELTERIMNDNAARLYGFPASA
jgi:predicted TIM-barrel fold metal-dependent hydrolase